MNDKLLRKDVLHPLIVCADFGGCFQYRVRIPFTELKKHNVSHTHYPYLPHDPERPDFETLANFVYPYDFVIIQRCFKLSIVSQLRKVCDLLGKKLVFETDDDYLHIPPHNPCFAEMAQPGRLQEFVQILSIVDLITVTTDELKAVYYPFNKNIVVLPNNVEGVHFYKDFGEMETDENGRYSPIKLQGFVHVPAYACIPNGAKYRLIRVGYTCNPTHIKDFDTIKTSWFKLFKRYKGRIQAIYIGGFKGDKSFYDKHVDELGPDNVMAIPPSDYNMYYCNIRNLDIGLAPLEANIFNQSKSPIKAIEYASWGIPSVLPAYVTYDRVFEHEQTAVFYHNQQEFTEQLERLIEEPDFRKKIGNQGRMQVANRHVESLPHNTDHRFNVYEELMGTSRPIKLFKPTKGVNDNGAEFIEASNNVSSDAGQSFGTSS